MIRFYFFINRSLNFNWRNCWQNGTAERVDITMLFTHTIFDFKIVNAQTYSQSRQRSIFYRRMIQPRQCDMISNHDEFYSVIMEVFDSPYQSQTFFLCYCIIKLSILQNSGSESDVTMQCKLFIEIRLFKNRVFSDFLFLYSQFKLSSQNL